MNTTASPAKLKSGAWGARVTGNANPGDVLTIIAASGKSWEAVVERVVWTNGEVSLCATANQERHSGRCKGCGRSIKDAPYHRAMGGYCGECAFDEFDM